MSIIRRPLALGARAALAAADDGHTGRRRHPGRPRNHTCCCRNCRDSSCCARSARSQRSSHWPREPSTTHRRRYCRPPWSHSSCAAAPTASTTRSIGSSSARWSTPDRRSCWSTARAPKSSTARAPRRCGAATAARVGPRASRRQTSSSAAWTWAPSGSAASSRWAPRSAQRARAGSPTGRVSSRQCLMRPSASCGRPSTRVAGLPCRTRPLNPATLTQALTFFGA